jgi:hypothetical protein
VRTTVDQLLDEFVARWTRDEPLEVDELLVQAGPEADELADLIDRFLGRAPRREPTAEALAFVRGLDDPPLLRARQAQGLKLDDLAAALASRLDLGEGARWKVRRYYQQLELGQLDASGVAASVWDALSKVLGRDTRELAAFQPAAPTAGPMFRAATADYDTPHTAYAAAARAHPELDEVDRLFTGG